jgi:hypothetical protein
MKVSRWLLPFTYGVDMQAIDAAVRLAEGGSAMLVAVSLISIPGKSPGRGARLEHIQQSKDFLESVYYRASEHKVPVERHEVFTSVVQERLTTLSSELCCDAIILLGRNSHPALLHAHEMKELLAQPPARLLYIHLAPPLARQPVHSLVARLLAWLRGNRGTERPIRAEQGGIIPNAIPDVGGEITLESEPVAQPEGGYIYARSTHLTGGRR